MRTELFKDLELARVNLPVGIHIIDIRRHLCQLTRQPGLFKVLELRGQVICFNCLLFCRPYASEEMPQARKGKSRATSGISDSLGDKSAF